jgi:hypothetical protein
MQKGNAEVDIACLHRDVTVTARNDESDSKKSKSLKTRPWLWTLPRLAWPSRRSQVPTLEKSWLSALALGKMGLRLRVL